MMSLTETQTLRREISDVVVNLNSAVKLLDDDYIVFSFDTIFKADGRKAVFWGARLKETDSYSKNVLISSFLLNCYFFKDQKEFLFVPDDAKMYDHQSLQDVVFEELNKYLPFRKN